MAKRTNRLIWALLIAAAVTSSADEAFQVCLKFRRGEIRRYSLEQSLDLTMQPPGKVPISIKSEIRAFVRQEVLAVAADGRADLLCSMDSWLRRNWRNETPVPADPEERRTMLDTRVRLRVSPRGEIEVIEPSVLPPGVDLDAYGDYGFLPSRPVAVGEEWRGSTAATHQGVRVNISTTNRLAKVTRTKDAHLVAIEQDIVADLPAFSLPAAGDRPGHITRGSGRFYGAGAVTFDLAAGIVREQAYYFQGQLQLEMLDGGSIVQAPTLAELTSILTLFP